MRTCDSRLQLAEEVWFCILHPSRADCSSSVVGGHSKINADVTEYLYFCYTLFCTQKASVSYCDNESRSFLENLYCNSGHQNLSMQRIRKIVMGHLHTQFLFRFDINRESGLFQALRQQGRREQSRLPRVQPSVSSMVPKIAFRE